MASAQVMWTSTYFVDLQNESFEVALIKKLEKVEL